MPTPEVNERWARNQRRFQRYIGLGIALAAPLWPLSYYASTEAIWAGHSHFWPAVSAVAFVGALVCTLGAALAAFIRTSDDQPLPGDNYGG